MLSHLVRLPGPDLSSIAPPSPCTRWTAFIFYSVRLLHQASSCLPRCLVTTAREKAAKCIRLLSALLYVYVFEPLVLFTKFQCIKHLRLSYECTANALKNAENEQKWDIQLTACSQSRSSGKWVKHTHTFFKSNNMSLIAVHFRDLVRLRSHQQRIVPEFTWTIPQTTLFKRTRVQFVGAHPSSEDSVHIIQTNRTLTSIEPGWAPKVLLWKHPKSQNFHFFGEISPEVLCLYFQNSLSFNICVAHVLSL